MQLAKSTVVDEEYDTQVKNMPATLTLLAMLILLTVLTWVAMLTMHNANNAKTVSIG